MNKEEFIRETEKLGLRLDDNVLSKLEDYYNTLIQENNKYNLTRITSEEDVYLKHFYDSLTIIKVVDIESQSICDLGSGAGFPGLVLAICFPNTKITLIESNNKKCYFLNTIKDCLLLNNVRVINDRAEEYAKLNREIFDIVTARAVAPLKHLLEYGIPLVKVGGQFIAMKSSIEEEVKNITNYYKKLDIKIINKMVFNLPKENSLRTILQYQKLNITDSKYPRRYSDIKKRDI